MSLQHFSSPKRKVINKKLVDLGAHTSKVLLQNKKKSKCKQVVKIGHANNVNKISAESVSSFGSYTRESTTQLSDLGSLSSISITQTKPFIDLGSIMRKLRVIMYTIDGSFLNTPDSTQVDITELVAKIDNQRFKTKAI